MTYVVLKKYLYDLSIIKIYYFLEKNIINYIDGTLWSPFSKWSWFSCFNRSFRELHLLKNRDFHTLMGFWDHFDDLYFIEGIFIWFVYYKNRLFFKL